jgi:hypothetical protein
MRMNKLNWIPPSAGTAYAVLLIHLDTPQGPLDHALLWAGADTIKRSLREGERLTCAQVNQQYFFCVNCGLNSTQYSDN